MAVLKEGRAPREGVRSRGVERVPQQSGQDKVASRPVLVGRPTMKSVVQDRYGAVPEDVLRVEEV
ncbi:MAG TPA: hypothetical protein VEX67_16940, partial [Solirubrobacteraceae bacterium]|nr:hypothetical protein [Solirubrobacteraceae bacterium]